MPYSQPVTGVSLSCMCHSEHFLDELKEFGRSYDLIGCGYKHREEQIQKKVCTLQDEVLLLEAGTCIHHKLYGVFAEWT